MIRELTNHNILLEIMVRLGLVATVVATWPGEVEAIAGYLDQMSAMREGS